jgi:peptide deformylase
MSCKPVVKMGNRQLAMPSEVIVDLDKSLPELFALVQDMKDTMYNEGGVGIAAPQIGINKRVIMFGFEKSKRYPDEQPVPFTVLINPVFKPLSNDMVDGWEGCLSVPGLRGLVPRFNKIEYSGYDLDGNFITRIAEGFHARAVQHEYDHLDGVLYPQRIKDLRFFGFEDELIKNPTL